MITTLESCLTLQQRLGIWEPLAGPKLADMTDAKYNLQDENAHSTILSDEVLYTVTDEEMAAEGSTLKDHLDALNSILIDLKNVEVKIGDEDAALILLVSLPPSFENFVNSLVVGKDTIVLKISNSRPRGTNPRDTCNYCKEEGHWKFNSPKLKGKGQVAAVAKDDSGSERDVVLAVVDYKGTPLVWIMDFACSFHMSPNRDWFVTYEEFDGRHVFMGNDSPCKIVSIGTIRIKIHDGVVRTLTDVHHVPDLKNNLISLGALDSKGFKYTSENGVLRVSKGAFEVMKETKGTSSLYTLQGETITCFTYVLCSKKSNSDLTMLWHMLLLIIFLLIVAGLLGGARYFLSIIDYFSRMTWVFMMKHKSGAFEKFKHWKILIENQIRRKIKRFLIDNGLEFCSREFNDFLEMKELEGIIRSPATAIDCKTPIEVWSGKPADYSKLRIFGCLMYYHVSEGKLDLRGKKGIFIGYTDGVKGYRIWSSSERRVILSQVVTFDKDYLFRVKQDPVESKLQYGVLEKVEDVPKQVEHSIAHDRPRRNAKAPSRFSFEDYAAYASQVAEKVESLEPITYREAITSKDSNMWIATMGEEIESLHKNMTWELVKLPERRKVVGSHHDLELEQLDVKTTFLHGDLEEEIYMSQPEGFVVQGKEDYVCKLRKSLYGLKQSPRQWYKRFDSFMVNQGFSRSVYDCCVYHKKASSGSLIYLLLYVDDMLVAAKDMEEVKKLKILLNT
ncbi:putative polyprotein [Tanacetum coccineum]